MNVAQLVHAAILASLMLSVLALGLRSTPGQLALATASRHPGVAVAIGAAPSPGDKRVPVARALYVLVAVPVSVPSAAWRKRRHVAAPAKLRHPSLQMKATITMRALPLILLTLLASLLVTELSGADDTWIRLGTRTLSDTADHDTLPMTGDGSIVGKLQLRVRGTAVRFQRIVVRYDNDEDDRIELSRDEIPAGGESRTIDLRAQGRVIRALDLWYDADSLGGRPAIVDVYGRR